MAETILSYLLAEESSNPQRISKKNGRSGIRRRRHLSYTLWVGDGEWENMAETIGEALGQVPGGSGLGVTVMQRIMGLVCEHKVLPLTQSPPPSGELVREFGGVRVEKP